MLSQDHIISGFSLTSGTVWTENLRKPLQSTNESWRAAQHHAQTRGGEESLSAWTQRQRFGGKLSVNSLNGHSVTASNLLSLLFFKNILMILSLSTQRYMHYISNEIPTSALPLQPAQQIVNIMCLLPPDPGDNNKHIQLLKDKLIEEVKQDYYFSLKKNVGNKERNKFLSMHPLF